MIADVSGGHSEAHPANKLQVSLARAEGMLETLNRCYDARRDSFVVNQAFVVQAVIAMQAFVHEAQAALGDLCERCDLSLSAENIAGPQESTAPANESSGVKFTFGEVANEPDVFEHDVQSVAPPVASASQPIAQTYDELMRKLTTAEFFAQEQQAIALPGTVSPLVPILRGLREELKKVRAA